MIIWRYRRQRPTQTKTKGQIIVAESNLTPQGDSTGVTWTLTGPMSLMFKVMGVFISMEKMVAPDFERACPS